MNKPNTTTLISVLGSSPAVITETLYALKDAEVFPSTIHIFTTTHGRDNFEAHNMLEIINTLCVTHNLKCFTKDSISIHVVTDANGIALSDLRSESDQESMANFMTHEIRQLVRDPNRSIHASIAGGRKSMSFYMGYIFSMFARPFDELSHVLVSSGYEVPGFYYPTQEIKIPNSNLDPKDAKIELATIPFIRLNTGLSSAGDLIVNDEGSKANKLSYSDSIAAYQLSLNLQDIQITLDTQHHTISINDKILDLSASNYAFYRMVLEDSEKDELSMTRSNFEQAEERFLKILGELCHFDFKNEIPFDCMDDLKDQLDSANIFVDQKTFNSIEKKGLNSTITDRFTRDVKASIQNICFGKTVELCEISICKNDMLKDEPDSRAVTKSGFYAVRLNSSQISIT